MEDSSSEALGASQIEENHVAKVSSPERRGKSNLFKSPKPNIKSRNENIFGDNNIIETEKREVNDNEQDIVTPVSEPFKITTQNKDTHSFDEKSNNEEEEYIPWWEVEMRKAKAIQEATEISIQEPPTQVSQTVINEKQLNTQVSLADKNKAYFKQKKQEEDAQRAAEKKEREGGLTAAALQILRAAEEEAEEHESRKSLHIARLGEPFVVQKKGALLGTATGSMSGSSKGGSNSRKSIAGGRGFVRVGVPQAGPELGSDSAKIFQYELESLPDDDEDDNRSLESLPDDSADESDQGRRISPKPVVTRPVSSISRPISMSRLAPEDSKSDLLLTDRSRGMLQSSKEVEDSKGPPRPLSMTRRKQADDTSDPVLTARSAEALRKSRETEGAGESSKGMPKPRPVSFTRVRPGGDDAGDGTLTPRSKDALRMSRESDGGQALSADQMEQLEHDRDRVKHHLLLGATFLTDSGTNILHNSGRQSLMNRQSLGMSRSDRPNASTFTMDFVVDDDCPSTSVNESKREG